MLDFGPLEFLESLTLWV